MKRKLNLRDYFSVRLLASLKGVLARLTHDTREVVKTHPVELSGDKALSPHQRHIQSHELAHTILKRSSN